MTLAEQVEFAISCRGAMQKFPELLAFASFVADKNIKSVLEIGSGNGGTFWLWCELFKGPDVNLFSIDLPNGPWGGSDARNKLPTYAKGGARVITFAGDSKGEAKTQFYKLYLPADLLFIDGDHSYDGVKADFENYIDVVPPGGLIAFHDICEHSPESGCEVKKFWDEIKGNYAHIEYISEPTNWGGIGVIVK